MKINFIEKLLGTGFYSGFVPFLPGTAGSFVALLIYLIPGFENPVIMLSFISIFTLLGIKVASKFEKVYGKDPAICVIDEFVGTWISLLLLPKNWSWVLSAFIVWRILDIRKPFPINKAENVKGGLGIMADDILAGFITFALFNLIIKII